MKSRICSLLLLIGFFGSCSQTPSPTFSATEEKSKVEDLIERYIIAGENEDFAMLESVWADDDQIMLIGTDSHEKLLGLPAIKNAFGKQFGLISDTYIAVDNQLIRINGTGNTAWFSQVMKYNFMYDSIARSFEGLRLTGVAEKGDDGWKLVQVHLSVPAQINIGK